MLALLIVVHVLASLVLILVVLLQSGKAGDLASAFGGGGSQTAFGVRSAATLLTKATTVCAVLFMLTSLSLAIMYNQSRGGTVMEKAQVPQSSSAKPAASGAAAAQGKAEGQGETGQKKSGQEPASPASSSPSKAGSSANQKQN